MTGKPKESEPARKEAAVKEAVGKPAARPHTSKKVERKGDAPAPPKKRRRAAGALFVHCETKLHILGSAPAAGLPDAAAARSADSALPCIPGALLQRALSSHFNLPADSDKKYFSEAQLLLFPLRTVRGIFAWCTSRERLLAYEEAFRGTTCEARWPLPEFDGALTAPSNACVDRSRLFLEEFSYPCQVEPRVAAVGKWLAQNAFSQQSEHQWWRAKIARDLVILPETELQSLIGLCPFVEQDPTDHRRHAEFVPAETVFFSVLDDELLRKELELTHILLGRGIDTGNGVCRLQPLRQAKYRAPRRRRGRKPGAEKSNKTDRSKEAASQPSTEKQSG